MNKEKVRSEESERKVVKIFFILRDIDVTDMEINFLLRVNERIEKGVFQSTKEVKELIAEELGVSVIYVSKMLQKFNDINVLLKVKKGVYKIEDKMRYVLTWGNLYIRIDGDEFSII